MLHNYEEARDLIETGDTILVTSVHSIMGRLTQFFTRSPYTHAGIAIWVGGHLYMAELNGGRNHLVPLSQLTTFDVYARPEGISAEAAETAILNALTHSIDYGYASFVLIGLLNWFRIKIFVHWRKIVVCSGYVVAILESCGWPEHSRQISPQGLSECLPMRFSVA